MNSLKASDIFSFIAQQNDTDDNNDALASTSHEFCKDKTVESKWAKYLDPSQTENVVNAQELASRDIHEAEAVMSRKTFPCDDVNNDSCNFEDILDDSNFETESKTDKCETKTVQCASFGHNSDSNDKCNLQEKDGKFHVAFADVTNIFESNEELDEPLDF